MELDDVQHFARIVSGCESISSRLEGGPSLTADGHYAYSVLKLHAFDAGVHAGQEGFLDSIKKGAKATKEWILKLIKAIRDWFSKTYQKTRHEINKLRLGGNYELNEAAASTLLTPLNGIIKVYKEIDDFSVSKADAEKGEKLANTIHHELSKDGKKDNGTVWGNVIKLLDHLEKNVKEVSGKADRAAASIPADEKDPNFAEITKMATQLSNDCKDLAEATNRFSKAIIAASSKVKEQVEARK